MLPSIIPPQKFELIRDKVALIALLEMQNQYAISEGATPNITKVYLERRTPFAPAECPAINISLMKADYDNRDAESVDGHNEYAIEVYTCNPTTNNARGDYLASVEAHRIVGMLRTIFESPEYSRLGFDAPFLNNRGVTGFKIEDGEPVNGVHSICAVMMLAVKASEDIVISDVGYVLTDNVTKVQIGNGTVGYKWVYARLHEGVYDVGYE